jgi:metal transporter CNNM
MVHDQPQAEWLIGLGIALCVVQSALFSGLNLAVFSLSRLRLEVEATGGNPHAVKLLALRKDANLTLATILWGNVGTMVLLTLLSESIMTGVAAFLFSTFVITFLGEIVPQAYFSRHALRVSGRLFPFLAFYRIALFPIAKPTALFLNWWLGPEGIVLLKERDFRALITRHVGAHGTEVGQIEALGAVNFLDLDDIPVGEEGEPVDPRSVVALPFEKGRPVFPAFHPAPDDPFLRQLDASGRKWVIFTDPAGQPQLVLNAHRFLRDVLFDQTATRLEAYWHRPIVVTDPRTKLGEVIGLMKVKPEHPEDDVIDNDLILIWAKQHRIITGADLLGRLLRGIAGKETIPPPKGEGGAARSAATGGVPGISDRS